MEVVNGTDNNLDQAVYQLVNQYQTALLRMCYLYLKDKALAEYAVQKMLIKAYKDIK